MPETYTIKDQHAVYFLTFQIVAWVDIFTRKCYKLATGEEQRISGLDTREPCR